MRVEHANQAVPTQRILGDVVFAVFEGGILRPISLVPSAKECISLKVLLDASDRIKYFSDVAGDSGRCPLRLHLLVHVVVDDAHFIFISRLNLYLVARVNCTTDRRVNNFEAVGKVLNGIIGLSIHALVRSHGAASDYG